MNRAEDRAVDKQLNFPGMNPPCETGSSDHDGGPTPQAVGEYLLGDTMVWMCEWCREVMWPTHGR